MKKRTAEQRRKNTESVRRYRLTAKSKVTSKKWQDANRDKVRWYYRKSQLKIPMQDVRAVPAHCELCGEPATKTLHLDHCHTLKVFRGWLCGPCNRAIGLFKDNSILMERAADYVRFGGPTNVVAEN